MTNDERNLAIKRLNESVLTLKANINTEMSPLVRWHLL